MANASPTYRQQQRSKIREIRARLAADTKASAGTAICAHLETFFSQNYPARIDAKAKTINIAAYLSSKHEASLDNWIDAAREHSGINVFVPVIGQVQGADQGQMHFHLYSKTSTTTIGHFGLRTLQNPEVAEQIEAPMLDCVLLPLVAFDQHGTRLGMGGGYYDRFFSNEASRPYMMGIGFDIQESSETLERSHWDVPLDAIITESGMRRFPSNR